MQPATVPPSIVNTLNANIMSTYSIGIDIGATNTDIGLVRNDGTVIDHHILSSQQYTESATYMRDISLGIRELMHRNGDVAIAGIGIGAPNGNHRTAAIEKNTANLRIKEQIPLGEVLGRDFNVPVALDNDANAAALGELVYGGAKGMRHFIMLTLGTGVGSGIVCDGKLLHGAHGAAGEWGHSIVNPEGRTCSCGRKGCIETYASARGICQTYLEELEASGAEVTEELRKSITCKQIGKAAVQGDSIALRAYAQTAHWLGISLANAAAFSEPEAIFLMGGPTRAGKALMEPLQKSFEDHLLFLYKGKIKLQFSQLDSNAAAILGAAALAN